MSESVSSWEVIANGTSMGVFTAPTRTRAIMAYVVEAGYENLPDMAKALGKHEAEIFKEIVTVEVVAAAFITADDYDDNKRWMITAYVSGATGHAEVGEVFYDRVAGVDHAVRRALAQALGACMLDHHEGRFDFAKLRELALAIPDGFDAMSRKLRHRDDGQDARIILASWVIKK